MNKIFECGFKVWIYWRVLQMSWKDRLTKEEILRRIDTQQEITFMIKKRKGNTREWFDLSFIQLIDKLLIKIESPIRSGN